VGGGGGGGAARTPSQASNGAMSTSSVADGLYWNGCAVPKSAEVVESSVGGRDKSWDVWSADGGGRNSLVAEGMAEHPDIQQFIV